MTAGKPNLRKSLFVNLLVSELENDRRIRRSIFVDSESLKNSLDRRLDSLVRERKRVGSAGR